MQEAWSPSGGKRNISVPSTEPQLELLTHLIGQKKKHPTALDETALLWATIFVSGGRRGLDVELATDDLVRLTGAVVAPIGRP